ncbi:PREDICTED: disintegrin and metalloproteinase domain-containing protein 18 isoform X2 [Chinchilla lanigera]|uniref:disintegrin and metalloproteinase domain-containing protein 18 isoform X2 n=1 Tax=Chinchilla lanigera TaxID=34839 RepID=UPI00038E9BC9|nr:PREDICTED: disintegrin and metalloproteinase domain-containing protein 18 isoform X2 [Chinchilla lanigera]
MIFTFFLPDCFDENFQYHTEQTKKPEMIYTIAIDGKRCTLHLRKHLFLSPNFLAYAYNETGSLYSESSYFMTHCHYQGYAAEFPNSVVTLSVCSGLRGLLQFENITYGIEPLESSARFEHIIYQVKNDNQDIPMLTKNYSNIQQIDQLSQVHLNRQEASHLQLLPRYLQMHIIVEKALFDYMGPEMMAFTHKIIQVIGLVNAMFTQLKLTVKLSSLELWSGKNPISTDGDADDILQRLLAWKRDSLIRRPYDIAYLLIYRKHPHYMGATFPGRICNKKYNAGTAMFPDGVSLEGFSVIIAQLLGLNIGLIYNNIDNCSCPRATCIMSHESVSSSGIKIFSNCSLHDYRHFVSKTEADCLHNFSNLKLVYQNQPVCGNGILESNEECDCGNKEECQLKNCCDYKTCKLKGSVECGSGPCCTSKCEFSVVGTPCRKSVDEECDFTEYCNGTSSQCVPDTYALNGNLCRLGTAYCYHGRCQNLDNQCAEIFGKGAQGAPHACFKEVNSPQERSGNCGFKDSQPLPCEQKDVLCGKLVCIQPHKNSNKSAGQSAIYSYIHDHECLSITPGTSLSSDGRDDAYVADGTVCGPQMYCVNKTCRKAHLVEFNCNATEKCKGNGICNNFGNCQCFPDHRPPDCEFQLGSPGGSIDDGNVKSDIIFIKEGYNVQRSNWIILNFFIFLPVFMLVIISFIKITEMRNSCITENTKYEGWHRTSHGSKSQSQNSLASRHSLKMNLWPNHLLKAPPDSTSSTSLSLPQ